MMKDCELRLPHEYCIQRKFRPRFIFALWFEGEFKTGQIEFYSKDYVTKLKSGRIQGWGESGSNPY